MNSSSGRGRGDQGKSRSDRRKALIELRRGFLNEGAETGRTVSDTILRSWRRSQQHGLDLDQRPALEVLSHAQLRDLRERNEMLLRAARGELEALHADARSTGSIVILTDPAGVILATVGSIDFAERASRVALRPGVEWSEAAIGTNAIGTAIAEMAPVSVDGAEHYFPVHAILGCSAVPIFDPAGAIIGVLDLSSNVGEAGSHALALVRRAVEQIERRLFEQRFGRHERIHFHSDPDLVMSPLEGLLAFEGSRLVGANRQALDLLGIDWASLGAIGYEQIFETRHDQIAVDAPIERSRIRTLRGSILYGRRQVAADVPARMPPPPRSAGPRVAGPSEVGRSHFDVRTRVLLERSIRLVDAGISILLVGEIGCGKAAMAREIHDRSRFAGGPYVVVDCSAEDIADVERDLFGDGETPGAAVGAEGGTLYLHLVETLPLRLQARLAEALRHDAPGGRGFNLVSSSHFGLADRVAAGGFSPDLMVRVAAHAVDLLPVRRHPDRRALILETWEAVARGRPPGDLPEETLAVLTAYSWPGNRRQLISTLRALAVLAEAGETLSPGVLPREIADVGAVDAEPVLAVDVEEGLDSIMLTAMRAALEAEGGNVARAARRLGIHRSTLYRHLNGSSSKD